MTIAAIIVLIASQVLGHSGIGITARLYSHLFPEARRDLMDRVGEVASPDS